MYCGHQRCVKPTLWRLLSVPFCLIILCSLLNRRVQGGRSRWPSENELVPQHPPCDRARIMGESAWSMAFLPKRGGHSWINMPTESRYEYIGPGRK
ncbi:hypothetical protein BDV23DRAFT_148492 [Aspergillus alliaceus]|uniref:Uncharacterized protein n=1 Tax=Petromyces alliaceus TaxID=209559 RepID=A0A5N7CIL1_PETAA|nr:hypothetical protein BDV23DRAFT_148492 [Aspergillus alliaceus]